ncbi:hypothetical protein ABIE93_005991 [Bradyrhizobium elkanii]|uniref:hypothetical protein n=1 Tax=Bradyrhizobium elkanii TaxID=29448 RepID=UPI0035190C53
MTKAPKLTAFRNCFEASMTFEEAIGCSGLSDKSPEVIEVLRNCWDKWERSFSADCRAESVLA